jgi:hypothetical protein
MHSHNTNYYHLKDKGTVSIEKTSQPHIIPSHPTLVMPLDYSLDPQRPQHYIVNKKAPFNAEPPLKLLVQNVVTPEEVFFHRNHGPIPSLDEEHFVQIAGLVRRPLVINAPLLKRRFKKVEVIAALQVSFKCSSMSSKAYKFLHSQTSAQEIDETNYPKSNRSRGLLGMEAPSATVIGVVCCWPTSCGPRGSSRMVGMPYTWLLK